MALRGKKCPRKGALVFDEALQREAVVMDLPEKQRCTSEYAATPDGGRYALAPTIGVRYADASSRFVRRSQLSLRRSGWDGSRDLDAELDADRRSFIYSYVSFSDAYNGAKTWEQGTHEANVMWALVADLAPELMPVVRKNTDYYARILHRTLTGQNNTGWAHPKFIELAKLVPAHVLDTSKP